MAISCSLIDPRERGASLPNDQIGALPIAQEHLIAIIQINPARAHNPIRLPRSSLSERPVGYVCCRKAAGGMGPSKSLADLTKL